MVSVQDVRELVRHHVLDKAERRLDDPPVQTKGAGVIAATPALRLIAHQHASEPHADALGPGRRQWAQAVGGAAAVPVEQGGTDVGRVVVAVEPRRERNLQPPSPQPQRSGLVADDSEAMLPPEVGEGLAADEFARVQRRGRSL